MATGSEGEALKVLTAPAKLNLFLDVVGRRADGYHDLETLFLALPWGDRVTVSTAPGCDVSLEVEGSAVVPRDGSNLAVRAAEAWRRAAGAEDRGLAIRLEKRIPPGAGLGGGSSDAAAVLRALDLEAGGLLGASRLHDLASEIGADVPFFLVETGVAIGRGRGDQLESLPDVAVPELVLILSALVNETARVFAHLDAHGAVDTPHGATLAAAVDALRRGDPGALRASHHNALADAARRAYPAFGALFDDVTRRIGRPPAVTGTGSALYVWPDPGEADELLERLQGLEADVVHLAPAPARREALDASTAGPARATARTDGQRDGQREAQSRRVHVAPRPALSVVVAAPPVVEQPADLARLPAYADLIELRLDLLPGTGEETALRRWVEASPRPVLATVRSVEEGGAFGDGPEAAARRLSWAAAAGAAWIDVECDVAPHVEPLPAGVRVLASFHGQGPVVWPATVGGRSLDHRKVARPVGDAEAFDRARDEARDAAEGRTSTVVPYGPLGAFRAACAHPEALLFGAAAGAGVVAGQPTLSALLDDLRSGEVGPDAELFGLLGQPPAASPSPALHNAVFRALGRDALYLPLPGLDVDEALALPFRGFSVTTPGKARALALAADADETARRVGAANTLVRRDDGSWCASNTDVEALRAAVPEAQAGDAAYVFGAGGYARAAVDALTTRGFAVRLGARDATRGAALARERDVAWGGCEFAPEPTDRVFVNATPAGADGTEPAFLPASLEGLLVLDAPYRAGDRETGVVRAARSRGALGVVNGRALLLAQAVGQARAFTGADVDEAVLRVALAAPLPLLLLGLRGAGKSTIGRRVAQRLGRPFLDLDDEVTRRTGRSPATWIREAGPEAFREAEASVFARIEGRRGVVVAAGGGLLESEAALHVARRATWPVWLDVAPERAVERVGDDDQRPRLTDAASPLEEARRLLARRAETWRRMARVVIDANDEIENVARRVGDAWVV